MVGEAPPSPAATRSRSLDGEWTLRLDPGDVGRDAGWKRRDADWPATECAEVTVPHSWTDPGTFDTAAQSAESADPYTGVAWYRRTVALDEPPDGRDAVPADRDAIIRFDAVDYETTVWVNGERCGHNRGGYLPFEVDATAALEAGENVVAVRVEDPEDLDEIPHGKQGEPWYSRLSGIWQSVSLELRPETRIEDVRVVPDVKADRVRVAVDVAGSELRRAGVRVRIEREGEVATRTDGPVDVDLVTREEGGGTDGSATVTLSLEDPTYWSPERPALYDVVAELSVDGTTQHAYDDHFGMREVTVEDGDLFLNGEPLFVRGALDQGYYPETGYRPPEEGCFEKEIETAKELGFNLLRVHVKPAHPAKLDAADRLGMLMWEEPANPTRDTLRSRREVYEQLCGLVERDFNRPAVIAWSCYNEEWGLGSHEDERSLWEDEEKQEMLARRYRSVRALDSTRLVCDNSGWAHVATDVNDYHRYVASPDRAAVWANTLDEVVDDPAANYAATETDPERAPRIVSEFGTWGLPDVNRLRERYGGDPPWFSHSFAVADVDGTGPVDSAARDLDATPRHLPAGFEARYDGSPLPKLIGDLEDAAATWQRRQFISLKDQIERMRTREGIGGYVLTQLTDVEWEFNGVLDDGRREKRFRDRLAAVNAPLSIVVTPESRVYRPGETVEWVATIVDDSRTDERVTVSWTFQDGDETLASGSTGVELGGSRTTAVEPVPIEVDTPDGSRRVVLEATVEGSERVTTTETPVFVVPSAGAVRTDRPIYVRDSALTDRLGDAGYDVTDAIDRAEIAAVFALDEQVSSAVANGMPVLLLPGVDAYPRTDWFSYRELQPGEDWSLASGLYAQASPLLEDVAAGNRLGWVFEGIYPDALATDRREDDFYHVGYVEGWIANWGSPLLERAVGDGVACSCTVPLGERYGDHPTATMLFDRLLAHLAE